MRRSRWRVRGPAGYDHSGLVLVLIHRGKLDIHVVLGRPLREQPLANLDRVRLDVLQDLVARDRAVALLAQPAQQTGPDQFVILDAGPTQELQRPLRRCQSWLGPLGRDLAPWADPVAVLGHDHRRLGCLTLTHRRGWSHDLIRPTNGRRRRAPAGPSTSWANPRLPLPARVGGARALVAPRDHGRWHASPQTA